MAPKPKCSITKRQTRAASAERFHASPNFALTFSFDGRPYVAKDSEPYIQYWLTERYRILLSLFSRRHGATAAEAIERYHRLTGSARTATRNRALARAIEDMRESGVLIGNRDDTSRYDATIAADYAKYRPFPQTIADQIVRAAGIGPESRILDLAGGPGDLALALAATSRNVSMMELSHGFVKAARARAARLRRNLTTLHDSANRLVYLDGAYDVITISQALHWLDDVMVCRGVCRLLRPNGSFFVVHAAFDVPDDHPLSFLLGRRSVLGSKVDQPFAAEVQPLLRRLSLLFEALDAPDVDRVTLGHLAVRSGDGRIQTIAPVDVTLFRQRRPMGLGFARAFVTARHIEASRQTPAAFWTDLKTRCATATREKIMGNFDWALLHFRRGTSRPVLPALEAIPAIDIDYEGPCET